MNDLFAVTLAPAPTAVPSHSMTASRILAVAEALQPDLASGAQIDALRLRLEMERAFGGSDAVGAWDWKLAYEAGEAALVLFLRKFGRALLARAGSPGALFPILAKVSGLLPTHTRRSEEMERFQQFSTPLPMGLAALAAAQVSPISCARRLKTTALRVFRMRSMKPSGFKPSTSPARPRIRPSSCNRRPWPRSRPQNRATARNCLLSCCATASSPTRSLKP